MGDTGNNYSQLFFALFVVIAEFSLDIGMFIDFYRKSDYILIEIRYFQRLPVIAVFQLFQFL
ncbi:MAG: hypothetical protein BWZ04_01939 [Firmicutes bacterium ADurb.BinA205]|nr:MAG: hypothetical protein BWZ04_01939 [Firmicutes bacterium ADurb.BinA205]